MAEREAQGKEAWLQYNPDNPNQVLYELMEFMACRCYVHNNQQSTVRGYLAAIPFFPQDVRRLGASNLTLHDSRCGKRDRSSARNVTEECTGQAAVDLDPFVAREASSFQYGRRGKRNVVGPGIVVFSAVPRV